MSVSIGPGGPGRRASAAKWSAAAVLALAAGVLLWIVGSGAAQEGGPGPGLAKAGASAGGGILVVAGQVTSDSYGLYLVDTKNTTMAVYQWVPRTNKLRLMAARNYAFDLQLDDYNNEKETAPAVIRQLVGQKRPMGATTQPD